MAFASRNRGTFDDSYRRSGVATSSVGGASSQGIYAGGSLAVNGGRQLQRPRVALDGFEAAQSTTDFRSSGITSTRMSNQDWSNDFTDNFDDIGRSQHNRRLTISGASAMRHRDRFSQARDSQSRANFAGSGFNSNTHSNHGMFQRGAVKPLSNRTNRFNNQANSVSGRSDGNGRRSGGGGGIGSSKRGAMNRRARVVDNSNNNHRRSEDISKYAANNRGIGWDMDGGSEGIRGKSSQQGRGRSQGFYDSEDEEQFDDDFNDERDAPKKPRKSSGFFSSFLSIKAVASTAEEWLDWVSLWMDSYVTSAVWTATMVCGYDSIIQDESSSKDGVSRRKHYARSAEESPSDPATTSRAYALYNLLLFNLTPLCIGVTLLLYGQYFAMLTAVVCAVKVGCQSEFRTWMKGVSSIFRQTWNEYHSAKVTRARRQRLALFNMDDQIALNGDGDIVDNAGSDGRMNQENRMPLFPAMDQRGDRGHGGRQLEAGLRTTVTLMGIFFSHVNQRAVYFPLQCLFHAVSAVGCSVIFGSLCIPLATAVTIVDSVYHTHVSPRISVEWKSSFTENKRHFASLFLFIPLSVALFGLFCALRLCFGLRIVAAVYSSVIGAHLVTVYLTNKPSLQLFVAVALLGCVVQSLLMSPFSSFVVSVCLFPVTALENALRFLS